jgi:FkbM family methyltransferase
LKEWPRAKYLDVAPPSHDTRRPVNGPEAVPESTAFLPQGRLRSFADRARNRLTPIVAKRRHRLFFRALTSASTLYLDMVANRCWEIERNGELRVLRAIAARGARYLFDVGANVGDWSIAAATLVPGAQIHSFEIIPETADQFRDRVRSAGQSRITVNALGLSDHAGTIEVAYLPEFSQGSSAAVVQPYGTVEARQCEVQTGDHYCQEHDIEHIDFLKLDVEGLEEKVLDGFGSMLSHGSIDVVQFEYGFPNATLRFLLGDFYELFERHGYVVGKVYPDSVEFRDYDPQRDEDFRGPNYVAVRRARPDLIELLAQAEVN